MVKINNKEIGKRIMRLRKEHGYTQEELSELIGYSKNHLSGIESGKYTVTTAFIFRLCAVLGRTPDYYLIGHVSAATDELVSAIRRLSENEQQLVTKMIELYLNNQK